MGRGEAAASRLRGLWRPTGCRVPCAPGTQDCSIGQEWVCGHPHQACPFSLCARPAVALTLGRAVTVQKEGF